MTRQPAPHRTKNIGQHGHRTMLAVGILGAAATLVLRPTPVVTWVGLGVLLCCLLVVLFRVLRRASRQLDTIMAEELESDVDGRDEQPVSGHETLRKTA